MIKTVNLQKIFKTEEVQTLALNDVNIEVKEGEFVAIMAFRLRKIHFTEYPRSVGQSYIRRILLEWDGSIQIYRSPTYQLA